MIFDIFILKYVFFYNIKDNINLIFRIPGFQHNATNIHTYTYI